MKLIVGLDPADGDLTSVRWARALAARFGASVEVVHALHYEPAEPGVPSPSGASPELPRELVAAKRARVRELLELEGGWAADVPITVVAGWAHRELAARAGQAEDGIVVVGPGRRRWIRGLLGTTADRLLRTSTVPVLVVRGPVAERLERILAPVDFSPVSKSAARVAVQWARALKAALVLFHVPQVEWCVGPVVDAVGEKGEMLVESEQATLERARGRLAALARELDASEVEISREFGRYGAPPADAIAARIAEEDVDLVVMGTHGRSGFERAILGSVAESVIHRSHVPVLVVPGRA